MSLTVQDLIQDSLEELVAVPAGDTPPAADLAKGLAVLKRMVEASNIHRGNIASLSIDTYTLTPGTQAYTIGPTGDFVAARPIRIERANILIASSSGTTRRPLNLLDDNQWAAKRFLNASGLPYDLYNKGDYPNSTYSFYPIPSIAYQFEQYTWQQFAQAALSDVLAIPPGYYEFWMYGLAIRLAAVFGKEPRTATLALFAEARGNVQALNCPSPRISSDEVGSEGRGREFYGYLDGYAN